jgi:hypothetical protein
MAEDCPIPSCDGALYYDTCEVCGHRETPPTARRSGGAGASRHALSDEDYKHEIHRLQRHENSEE